MAAPDIWVAKDDGSDIIRAASIVGVGRDYNGNITIRLSGGDQAAVTLVTDDGLAAGATPVDFHLQLRRRIAELAATAEPAVIRPVHEDRQGWSWRADPL
jgi:hypothetical protein